MLVATVAEHLYPVAGHLVYPRHKLSLSRPLFLLLLENLFENISRNVDLDISTGRTGSCCSVDRDWAMTGNNDVPAMTAVIINLSAVRKLINRMPR